MPQLPSHALTTKPPGHTTCLNDNQPILNDQLILNYLFFEVTNCILISVSKKI